MKPCYYKVKTVCGEYDQGDILDAFLVVQERGMRRALLLVPSCDKMCCPSLVMCDSDGTHKRKPLFVEKDDDSFINLTTKQAQMFEVL